MKKAYLCPATELITFYGNHGLCNENEIVSPAWTDEAFGKGIVDDDNDLDIDNEDIESDVW